MVGIVLALPPINAEALEDISDQMPEDVVDSAVTEHLVVQEVVGEPSRLLPCEAKKEG